MSTPAQPAALPRYRIECGWLVIDTGVHDCAGGTPESSGAHESHCGLGPVMHVEMLHRLITDPIREWGVQGVGYTGVEPCTTERGARWIERNRRVHGAPPVTVMTRLIPRPGPWEPAPPDPEDPATWPFPPESSKAAETDWRRWSCPSGHENPGTAHLCGTCGGGPYPYSAPPPPIDERKD